MKNIKLIILVSIVLIVLIIAIVSYYFLIPIKNFNVQYFEKFSSSGGDRNIDIFYTVVNGEITLCNKSFTISDSNGIRTTLSCDISELTDSKYPKSHYRYQSKVVSVNYGRGMYTYTIQLN